MKKVVIISTSLRSGSNSEAIAEAVAKGAREAGNDVTVISLKNKNLAFCKGCMACQKLGKCVIKDDANDITDAICSSDVVVWATPIYYYSVSGSMKTMIDRANSLYTRDYKFREVYLVATAADDAENAVDGAKKCVQGWIDCLEKVESFKTFFAGGIENSNSVPTDILNEACDLGNGI
ncbi:MAG: flavodoxin family protein [Clostridia bacterium]|nr:flavodoxin family protein [Clostridia bacterium]